MPANKIKLWILLEMTDGIQLKLLTVELYTVHGCAKRNLILFLGKTDYFREMRVDVAVYVIYNSHRRNKNTNNWMRCIWVSIY